MSHPVVIRTAKLRTLSRIRASGSHTWRERTTPNADPDRTPTNTNLRTVTSSSALVCAVEARLALAQEAARDPVRCIEYLVTANAAAFREGGGTVDADAYLRDALAWIEQRHGAANVVAANIQRDETAPHLVVYVVPLLEVAGRERKRSVIVGNNPDGTKRRETRVVKEPGTIRLSAAHWLDGREKLSKLQTEFAEQVGRRHGLVRGVERSRATHQTVKTYYSLITRPTPLVLVRPSTPFPKPLPAPTWQEVIPGTPAARRRALREAQHAQDTRRAQQEHRAHYSALQQAYPALAAQACEADNIRRANAQRWARLPELEIKAREADELRTLFTPDEIARRRSRATATKRTPPEPKPRPSPLDRYTKPPWPSAPEPDEPEPEDRPRPRPG